MKNRPALPQALIPACVILLGIIIMAINVVLYVTYLKPNKQPSRTQSTNAKKITDLTDHLNQVKNTTKKSGAVAAWNEFYETYASDASPGLHDVAHYIGYLLYEEKGVDGLHICRSDFAFGCYHGLIERFIEREGTANFDKVIAICKSMHSQIEITCYHGIGHGVLTHYSYEIPKALSLCDQILNTTNQVYCYKGVFMENAGEYALEDKRPAENWPCNVVMDKYKDSCYEYLPMLLARYDTKDTLRIAKACLSAEKDNYKNRCVIGLGQQIGQENLNNEAIRKKCAEVAGAYAYECITAAAEEQVFQKQSYENANALCEELPGGYIKDCQKRISFQKELLI